MREGKGIGRRISRVGEEEREKKVRRPTLAHHSSMLVLSTWYENIRAVGTLQ